VGDPFGDVDQGPQVDADQFNKILNYIKLGQEQGAQLRWGVTGRFLEGWAVGLSAGRTAEVGGVLQSQGPLMPTEFSNLYLHLQGCSGGVGGGGVSTHTHGRSGSSTQQATCSTLLCLPRCAVISATSAIPPAHFHRGNVVCH
jgi:hypothetical protein